MNTNLLLQNTINWRQFFFHDPLPEDLSEVLPIFLKQRSQAFIETVPYSFTKAQTQEFNAWYWSSEGQDVLRLACNALWKQMATHAQNAQPAHDARHAMYKVPSAALAYIHAEQVFMVKTKPDRYSTKSAIWRCIVYLVPCFLEANMWTHFGGKQFNS